METKEAYTVKNPEHKFFFCHFANQAQHNAHIILKDVEAKLGLQSIKDTAPHQSLLFKIRLKENPTRFGHMVALLEGHFRFMPYLKDSNDPEKNMRYLQNMLYKLNNHRNYFSHYYYKELHFSNPADRSDTDLFKVGTSSSSTACLMYLLRHAVKDAKNRMIGFSDDDFSLIYDAVENKDHSTKRKFYELSEETNFDKCTVFFLSFFLEKKDANELISKIKGMRDTRTKQQQATRQAFLQFCSKLPYPKLEGSQIWFAMLNELNKVPAPLYNVIADIGKKKFIITDQTEEDNGATLKRSKDSFPYFALRFFEDMNYLPGIRFQIYLGQVCTESYPKLINGQLQNRKLVKDVSVFGKLANYLNKNDIPKQWSNEYKVSFVENENPSDGSVDEKSKETFAQNVLAYAPQYQIHDGKIAFAFEKTNWTAWREVKKNSRNTGTGRLQLNVQEKADGVLSLQELPNLFLYAYLHKEAIISQSPAEYIRQYIDTINSCIADIKYGELKPVEAERIPIHTKEKNSLQIDAVREKRVDALRKVLREKYNIKPTDLPDLVKEYALGYVGADMREGLISKIQFHKNIAIQLLKEAKDAKLEKGKKKGLTAGKIATFLAYDFTKFVTHENKPNDIAFDTLQEYIAYFAKNIHMVDTFLHELKIAGGENHLFLKSPWEYEKDFKNRIAKRNQNSPKKINAAFVAYGIKNFYKDYLFSKIKYLENVLNRIEENTLPETELTLLVKIFDIEQKEKEHWNYSDIHVRLPRGIFSVAISEAIPAIKKKFPHLAQLVPNTGHTIINPSFLVKQLFPEIQDFYNLNREYSNKTGEPYIGEYQSALKVVRAKVDAYKQMAIRTTEEQNQMQSQIQLLKKIDEFEKSIRFTQTTDRVLWQMLKMYFHHTTELDKNTIDLTNVSLENIGANLKSEGSKNFLDTSVTMTHTIHNKKVTAYLPIKQYGAFRRFLKDKRLKNLFDWLGTPMVEFNKIKTEISEYDIQRDTILKNMFEFEKIMHYKLSNQDIEQRLLKQKKDKKTEEEADTCLNHSSYLWEFQLKYNRQKETKDQCADNMIREIIDYRNTIEHNAYPKFNQLLYKTLFQENQIADNTPIFKTISNHIINKYADIISKVETLPNIQ